MQNCILITNRFPYGKGEVFIRNELPILANNYDNVYIFSIDAKKGDKLATSLPPNVKSYPLSGNSSRLRYIIYTLRGISCCEKKLFIHEEKVIRRIICLYTRGRALFVSGRILDLLRKLNIDCSNLVVYSYWFSYQAVAAWIMKNELKGNGKISAVSRAHGYDLYWERNKGNYLPYQDVSIRELDKVFPCSDFGVRYLLEKYPWGKKKIELSRLGTIDHGVAEYHGELTYATCCSLIPLKRMALFAEAFCKLASQRPEARWLCIGDGPDFDKIYKIITAAGLLGNVTFTGNIDNEEIMKLYKVTPIRFFCNVSTSEGVPVSIMEAESFGIPIIATNVGGTSEIVCREYGFILDADVSNDELASTLLGSATLDMTNYMKMRKCVRLSWEKKSWAIRNYNEFCDMISCEKE